MRIDVTGLASGAKTQKGSRLMTARAVFDLRVKALELVSRLIVVEGLQIKLANIEITSEMFRMTGHAFRSLVSMKTLSCLDSRA